MLKLTKYEVVCETVILTKFGSLPGRETFQNGPPKWNFWTAEHRKMKFTM